MYDLECGSTASSALSDTILSWRWYSLFREKYPVEYNADALVPRIVSVKPQCLYHLI